MAASCCREASRFSKSMPLYSSILPSLGSCEMSRDSGRFVSPMMRPKVVGDGYLMRLPRRGYPVFSEMSADGQRACVRNFWSSGASPVELFGIEAEILSLRFHWHQILWLELRVDRLGSRPEDRPGHFLGDRHVAHLGKRFADLAVPCWNYTIQLGRLCTKISHPTQGKVSSLRTKYV